MDEDRKRRWDVRLGMIAPLLTVVGILVGVWQFNKGEDNRRTEAITSEQQRDALEFRRRLWQQKLESYEHVAELAGAIVASHGDTQKKAYQQFQSAYWGTMILVEDPRVERAMIAFDREYRDTASGWSRDPNRLKIRADELASTLRTSLQTRALEQPAASPK